MFIINLNKRRMKIILLALGFLFIGTSLFAQNATVTGVVKNNNNNSVQNTNVAIEGTTLGTTTNENGYYEIENVPAGEYYLVVSFIGYKTTKTKFTISSDQSINIDVVSKEDVSELEEVQIVSNIGATEIKPQKVIYSVEKLASQAGGTAGDILKNMPSVSMGGSPGENKDIRYRGLGKEYTKVLINGRNAGVTGGDRQTILDLIPASQIERIEIESNPSADSQSDGVNGIVNIILKDGVSILGSSGNLGFIVDSENGYNGSAQYHQSFEKFQFSVGIDKLTRNIEKFDDGTITKFDDDGAIEELTTIDKDEYKFYDNTGARLNLNYSPSDNISFQAEYLYGDQNQIKEKEELNLTSNPDGSFKKGKARIETEDKDLNYHNAYFGTQAKIGSGLLKVGINVNLSEESKVKLRNDFKTDNNGIILELDDPKRQQDIESISTDVILPSLNYEINLNNMYLKAGYQGFYTEFTSTLNRDKFNFAEGTFENSDASKNNFVIQEDVHAFFALAEWYKDKWSVEGGLRYEIVDVNSISSVDTIPEGVNNYDFLLPNLHIVYNLTDKSYLNFSFGRRLRRPSYEDLNPFIEIKDLTEIKRGNPDLNAESSWAYELGYLRKFNKIDFGTNVFIRDINN
ncbi:MAG: TonB-dependent receptor, partial [Cyclobacteriaceae bacterium]